MQSANEWLLENNFIEKITRGRRSTENNNRLYEAWLSGVRFRDWEPAEGTDHKGNYATKNATPVQSGEKVIADIRYTYPEKDWEAFATVNGKRVPVGMRECCSNCYRVTGKHMSLVAHYCDAPSVSTVIVDGTTVTPIEIVKRTTPLNPLFTKKRA